VMYVRNYRDGIDLAFEEVFGTSDRGEIERFCQKANIECEFLSDSRLRTRQRCPAVAVHPRTGRTVWFNQAHLFHTSNLDLAILSTLRTLYDEEDLPRNCYYGNGSAIDSTDLDCVREAYRQERVVFPWREGDVLMLDNMLVAHGREPFIGDRKIAVAMAGLRSLG
jgi:alpha-ketoglutarate-dependent taurine dioxygenase